MAIYEDMKRVFGTSDLPPTAVSDPRFLANYFESSTFIDRLRGVRWEDILDSISMQRINRDAAVWIGYMPLSWFPYYLPALMVVAYSGDDAFSSNLRGLLEGLLVPRANTLPSIEAMRRQIETALTDDQQQAIELYVSPAGSRDDDSDDSC